MHITLPGGISHVQHIVYEQLPQFCGYCSMLGHLEGKCKWRAPAPDKTDPGMVTHKVWRKVEKEIRRDEIPVNDDGNDMRANGSAGIENLSGHDACMKLINPHPILDRGNSGFELGGDSELNIDIVVQNRFDLLKENSGEVMPVPGNQHKMISASHSRPVLVDRNASSACGISKSGEDQNSLTGKSCHKPGKSFVHRKSKDPGRGARGTRFSFKNASSLLKKRSVHCGAE
ncbi:hypothetical protein Dimus_007111 [Dionaea muscipula]